MGSQIRFFTCVMSFDYPRFGAIIHTLFMIRNRLQFCLGVVALLAGAAVTCLHAGEAIVFSNPDTAIAAPKRETAPKLPGVPTDIRGLGFGEQPQAPMPYVPPPVRNEPRREKKTIFDDPAIFSDRSEQKQEDRERDDLNPFARNQRKAGPAPYEFQTFDPMRKQELD